MILETTAPHAIFQRLCCFLPTSPRRQGALSEAHPQQAKLSADTVLHDGVAPQPSVTSGLRSGLATPSGGSSTVVTSAIRLERSASEDLLTLPRAARQLQSYKLDDISPCETITYPGITGSMIKENIPVVADLMKSDIWGVKKLLPILKPTLARFDPKLAEISPRLASQGGRRARVVNVLSTLADDPRTKLFTILDKHENIQGMLGLAEHGETTHVAAWVKSETRNQGVARRAMTDVFSRTFEAEPNTLFTAAPPEKAKSLFRSLGFSEPAGEQHMYSLEQAAFVPFIAEDAVRDKD